MCLLSILVLTVSGCATHQQQPALIEVTEAPVVPEWKIQEYAILPIESVSDLFTLTDKQRNDFLVYFSDPQQQQYKPNQRLANYLESILRSFDYKGNTYTATEALMFNSGNCLSLAIVTSALADLTELNTKYQTISSAPVYRRKDNILAVSSHVRTHLYSTKLTKSDESFSFTSSRSVIDYFPEQGNVKGSFVDEQDFLSMFYQNKAASLLFTKDYQQAYSYLAGAMAIDEFNPETLNLLAVLHSQLGNNAATEALYKFAIEETQGSVNLYSNYLNLLKHAGRIEEWRELQSRLPEIEDDNPYEWIDIANSALQENSFNQAIEYFKRAVESAPYLHEGYVGLAKAYYSTGKKDKAIDAMKKSIDLAYSPSEEAVYIAKLQQLKASPKK
jgi:tetratricopeptide (TPR) repeat protein